MPAASTLLILVRHGRTEWNAQGRFLGRTDLGLDEIGLLQASERARDLPWSLDAIYCSSLLRARQTAAAFGEPVVVAGLEELDQGDLEGVEAAAAIQRWPEFFRNWADDPTTLIPPGSTESLGQVQQRALAAVRQIATAHRGGVVGVVSHQLVLASLQCAVHGMPLRKWRSYRLENLQAVAVREEGGVLLQG